MYYENQSQQQYQTRKNLIIPAPIKLQTSPQAQTADTAQPPIMQTPQTPPPFNHNQHHRNCSGCYVQQLESDINDLLRQLKHGEMCYDNLAEENKQLKGQMDAMMRDEQYHKAIEKELQQVQAQLSNMKQETANQIELGEELRQRKLEIEKLKQEVTDLQFFKQEVLQLKQQNHNYKEEAEKYKYLEMLNNDRGEQITSLQLQVTQLQQEREQLKSDSIELAGQLRSLQHDYQQIQELLVQYKLEIQRLRIPLSTSQDIKHLNELIQQKEQIIIELRSELTNLKSSNYKTHEHELMFLNNENKELKTRLAMLQNGQGKQVPNHLYESQLQRILELQQENDRLNHAASNYLKEIEILRYAPSESRVHRHY